MGNLFARISPNSWLSQHFPPPSKYDPARDMPDLTGKVAIVTGGNTGIGYHTVKQLVLKNAKVYLAARSVAKADHAAKRLREETHGKEPLILEIDLSDLRSIRTAAQEFLSKEERLDILFNNAAVFAPPIGMLTAQEYDLQFGTNTLGHYFLTKLLLPALGRSTSYHGTKARVVHTSSYGHNSALGPSGIDYTLLKGGPARDQALKRLGMTGKWKLYSISKLGNVLVSNSLARHNRDIIVSCALHPGGTRTELQRHSSPWLQSLSERFVYPTHNGALTQLWAGTSPEGEGFNGKYLIPWARIGRPDPRAANEKTQDELLKWIEEQIKGF